MISFTTITEEEKSINLGNHIQIVDLWILYGFNMLLWLGIFNRCSDLLPVKLRE